MGVNLNPYINFRSSAREAMEFYHSVLGGNLNVMTFEQGGMPVGPDDKDKVMHAQLDGPNGLTLMASDTPPGMQLVEGSNMSVSLSGDDDATLSGYWKGLSEGATITEPLAKAPWGDSFGMLTDKFGVHWMVNISGKRT